MQQGKPPGVDPGGFFSGVAWRIGGPPPNFIEIDVTPPGGDAVRRSGHTLTIFRKQDGRWPLARDANLVMLAH